MVAAIRAVQAEQDLKARLARRSSGGGAERFLTTTTSGERIQPGSRLFGATNDPTLRTAGGKVLAAEDVALPGTLPSVSEETRAAIQQFLNPQLSGEQGGLLAGIRRRSAGQGLFGGAVEGLQRDLSIRLRAENRAAAFQPALAAATERIGQLRQSVAPFIAQGGGIFSAFSQNQRFGTDPSQLLRALGAFGENRAAALGIASASGRTIATGGDVGDEEQQIAGAVSEFLSPSLTDEGRAGLRGAGQAARRLPPRFRGAAIAASQRQAREPQQAGAAAFLAGTLGERLSSAQGAVAELSGQSLPLSFLSGPASQIGGLGAAEQLLGFDTSPIAQLFASTLREGPTRTARPTTANLGGLMQQIRARSSSQLSRGVSSISRLSGVF